MVSAIVDSVEGSYPELASSVSPTKKGSRPRRRRSRGEGLGKQRRGESLEQGRQWSIEETKKGNLSATGDGNKRKGSRSALKGREEKRGKGAAAVVPEENGSSPNCRTTRRNTRTSVGRETGAGRRDEGEGDQEEKRDEGRQRTEGRGGASGTRGGMQRRRR